MKSLFIDLKPKCLHHCALRCRKLLNIDAKLMYLTDVLR